MSNQIDITTTMDIYSRYIITNEQTEQKAKSTASPYLDLFCKKYSCAECEIKDRCSVYNTTYKRGMEK